MSEFGQYPFTFAEVYPQSLKSLSSVLDFGALMGERDIVRKGVHVVECLFKEICISEVV